MPLPSSPPRRVTLRDIAARLNISSMTVSLALRDDPRIAAGRRAQIRTTAREMGYEPNAMAVALVHQRGGAPAGIQAGLAWINAWQEPERFHRFRELDRLWRAAVAAAARRGFRLDEFVVDRRLSFRRLDGILYSRGIAGIIVPPHGPTAVVRPDRHSLDWSRYSVVRIGYSLPDLPAHVVAGNQMHSTMLACQKIRGHGYARIGYVCPDDSTVLNRAGFLFSQSARSDDGSPAVLRLPPSPHPHADRLRILRRWLEAFRPDAILSELGELRDLLGELGLRVPADVALAATSVLDGNADAGVDQRADQIGETAVDVLTGLLHAHDTGLPACPREVLVQMAWRDGTSLPTRQA